MYEQGSFEPVARVVQLSEVLEKQRIDNAVTHVWQYMPSGIVNQDVLDNVEKAKQPLVKIYHCHNNHLGTPQELTNQDGDVIWLSYDRAWGGSFDTIYKQQFIDNFALKENELQPIKFQGQSLDVETGLHYNRFRYYDSDVGMFISRDPIGLLGGNNVFQYAPNPVMWIDPWGLSTTNPYAFLDEAISRQGSIPEGSAYPSSFKEKWTGTDGIKYEVRSHPANPAHGKSGSIFRVSAQEIGKGTLYLDEHGQWHPESELKENFKGGLPNPNYNANAARDTHIQIDTSKKVGHAKQSTPCTK